jgi:hypothetical protein
MVKLNFKMTDDFQNGACLSEDTLSGVSWIQSIIMLFPFGSSSDEKPNMAKRWLNVLSWFSN